MSDRDKRLAPRLLEALLTLENDTEIAATVRQLRRIGGAEAFKPQPNDAVPLRHDSHIVTTRLRSLGLMLRQVNIQPDPGGENAKLQQVARALERGDTIAGEDVAFLLSCLVAIIDNMRQQRATVVVQAPFHTSSTGFTGHPWAQAYANDFAAAREAARQRAEELRRQTAAAEQQTEELRRRQADLAEQLQRRGT